MGESISATWNDVFESRGMELHPAPAPPGSTPGTSWHQGLTAFETHSFVRLLISEDGEEATVFVELAAGPPEEQETRLANAACQWLSRATPASWELVSAEMPANLRATLANADALYASLDALLAFMARASEVSSANGWLTFFGASGEPPSASVEAQPSAAATSGSPFETIGQGDTAPRSTDAATAASAQRLEVLDSGKGPLTLNVHLSHVLGSAESQRLVHALSHYLHARYDVQAQHAADPSSAHTLSLAIEPERYLGSRRELASDLERFCKRLGDYIDAGGDLQDYLGINEVVLPSPRPTTSSAPRPAPVLNTASPSHHRAAESADSGVVFDLSSASASTARELVQGDFTDSRLKRDDAQTALVDLVLRHPGYSERRINQVLTILLSIDYAAAERLAESAPCVIAWGLSRERALSFKDVLQSAGGKALLVEPGTFGES